MCEISDLGTLTLYSDIETTEHSSVQFSLLHSFTATVVF